jgi:hypothetical protein
MRRFPPLQRERMTDLILIEILAVPAECSRGRHNPRVVKRKMSNFPTKARATPGSALPRPFHYPDHIRVVAPPEPPSRPVCRSSFRPTAAAKGNPKPAPRPDRPKPCRDDTRNDAWREHVRAWRASGLSRTAYCQRHDLEVNTFHHWVARLRHTFRHPRKTSAAA